MPFLAEALIFLVAALAVVPLCQRLGFSSVLGYLGAGVLIGPGGLGLFGAAGELLHFAEIGVVLLLFLIGLELEPRRLWIMRHLVFGLGSLQVAASWVLLAVLLLLAGLEPGTALLLGFALALSSTAFVLQLLGEQHKLDTAHGRAALGTLLLQDLAVIPALAAISLLAERGSAAAEPLRPELIVLVIIGAVAARYLLRPALKFVAASGIQELFTAAALTLVVGAALAMAEAGLSMALGAFVAGVMVADSEYRHQLEADVNPFKGLLLGLFFMAVGMSVNLRLLIQQPLLILGLTAGLVTLKALLLLPLARWYGLSGPESLRAALVLSQGGEFAFVLLTAAVSAGLLASPLAAVAVLVVTLSMATTPLLVSAGERWLARDGAAPPFDHIEPEHPTVVVAGFGRVGQIIARVLIVRGIRFTALEINPHQVEFVRRYGNEVFYGDARRLDVLRAAGVPRARALVLAVGDQAASLKIVERVRSTCPGVAILARATTRRHELELRALGVDYVMRDTLYSSLRLATAVLERLGVPAEEAQQAVAEFEARDAEALDRQAAVLGDAVVNSTADRATEAARAADELERLVAEDVDPEGARREGRS